MNSNSIIDKLYKIQDLLPYEINYLRSLGCAKILKILQKIKENLPDDNSKDISRLIDVIKPLYDLYR